MSLIKNWVLGQAWWISSSWGQLGTYRTAWWGVYPIGTSSWQGIGTSHGGRRVTFPKGWREIVVSTRENPTKRGLGWRQKLEGKERDSKDHWTVSYLLLGTRPYCKWVDLRSWSLLRMDVEQIDQSEKIYIIKCIIIRIHTIFITKSKTQKCLSSFLNFLRQIF